MVKIPGKNEFPGTGDGGNGISPTMKSQAQYLDQIKTDGCMHCHQIGNKATRTIPAALGEFKSGPDAWLRRIQSGQASREMIETIDREGVERTTHMLGDWTDRIAGGELPFATPPRPQGEERNVVITVWDWSSPKSYLHDEIATDKRNPTVNPYGKILWRLRTEHRSVADLRSGHEFAAAA